jgi:hypothetical protein
MKKLLLMLLLVPVLIYGQDCRYEQNDVDKFTKKTVIITKPEIVWKDAMMGYSLSFKVKKIDDQYIIWMRYSSPGSFIIEKYSKLMLLTKNQETFELNAFETVIPKSYSNGSYVEVDYLISKETYEKLKNSIITDVRLYTSEGYIDKKLKENKQGILPDLLRCID